MLVRSKEGGIKMKDDLLTVAYDDDGEYPVLIIARSRNGVTVVINQKNGDEAREFYKMLTEVKNESV